jgi:hypothetical protein
MQEGVRRSARRCVYGDPHSGGILTSAKNDIGLPYTRQRFPYPDSSNWTYPHSRPTIAPFVHGHGDCDSLSAYSNSMEITQN